jgi:PhzF family phenazine biosynthesis protein
MQRFSIFQVDAFTHRRFAGNPAAVVPLAQWLSDEQLQAIAAENNLSETAYFVPEGEGYAIRWFTPVSEVRLCGHATLATAHVLFAHLGFAGEQLHFSTREVGPLTVARIGDQTYQLNFPADEPRPISPSAELADILGAEPLSLFTGADDLLAIFEDQDAIDRLRPNFGRLATLDRRGLIASAPGREVDFVSRCFFPAYGIDEDPVTGSAHTLMTPYWAAQLGKTRLTAQQRSARRGELVCELALDRVLLDGGAVTYLQGEIQL